MTEGNFGRCGKLHTLDWLFFLGYVPFPELRFMLKLSNDGLVTQTSGSASAVGAA